MWANIFQFAESPKRVLVTLRLAYRTISPERCAMTYLWVNLIELFI